ncbi:cysteine protease ATG4D-like [Dendronephthya gigantea]|uniref:cysteine protease ATG4D-like n=1 Tax=Dendronephthya gigantea TaxID=151771 RepID=UPI00106D036F|nr:cysteine protease ATG4D-like [Dendronephthya gigantea]
MTTMLDDEDISSVNRISPSTSRRFEKTTVSKFRRQTSEENGKRSDGNERSDGDTVKRRLLSAWNNVKFGLTSPSTTTFAENHPAWILGKCYTFNSDIEENSRLQKTHLNPPLPTSEFYRHFSSLMWFTYRKDFPQVGDSVYTTDTGWGCMIRSAQMMLATGLSYYLLGRDFRTSGRCHSRAQRFFYKAILRFFNDSPADLSPFSLHKLVKLSESFGKQAGDWFGPSLVAHVIKKALEESNHQVLQNSQGLRVYVSQDCTIYRDDVIRLCQECGSCNKQCSEDHWRSLIILVPVRLGGENLNPIYQPCVKALLTLDCCIGIIGGRPKHSLYFVGFQEDNLIYLDPHFCQPAVDMTSEAFPPESFHCDSPRKIPIRKMDPSCTIGFYCATREDFETFCTKATEVVSPPMQKGSYPMFIVASGNCDKLMSTPHLESSLSFSDTKDIPTSDLFEYETGIYRNGEKYRVHEVGGENLALGDRPAEDYVVLGSVKNNESFDFGDF